MWSAGDKMRILVISYETMNCNIGKLEIAIRGSTYEVGRPNVVEY